MASLSGDLATPPLTPPQSERDEAPSPRPLMISEPVNGNRNNVSDSAHANSASFMSTTGHVISNGVPRKQSPLDEGVKIRASPVLTQTQSRASPVHAQSRLNVEPPALVVIGKGGRGEEDGEERMAVSPSGSPVEENGSIRGLDEASNREASLSSKPYASDRGGSLQSMVVTSVGDGVGHEDPESGRGEEDDDDVDLDLVVVEDEEMPLQEPPKRVTPSNLSSQSQQTEPRSMSQHISRARDTEPVGSTGAETHRGPLPATVNGTSEHLIKNHTPSSKSAGLKEASNRGFHDRNRNDVELVRSAGVTNVKQAAKVKQFFTTIQQHGNKLGNEVAEQVQELIHALVVS